MSVIQQMITYARKLGEGSSVVNRINAVQGPSTSVMGFVRRATASALPVARPQYLLQPPRLTARRVSTVARLLTVTVSLGSTTPRLV
jgi:hypothetical protein